MLGAFAVLMVSLWALPAAATDAGGQEPSGDAIYRALASEGLLVDYMPEAVSGIVGSLVNAAGGRWSGFGVNRPYREGWVNVYLVDAKRMEQGSPIPVVERALQGGSLVGNAFAHEPSDTILVDVDLFRSLVTAALLLSQRGVDTMRAAAQIEAHGVDAYRDLWDPQRNPSLANAGYGDDWVIYASGAAAFVLAHEMGHLALGANPKMRRRPEQFTYSDEDRDILWACTDLLDASYRRQREIEAKADDVAVDLLSRVNFPPGTLDRPMLRFELGARWYTIYGSAKHMVRALTATESPNIQAMLRRQFGDDVFETLAARKQAPGEGSVRVFFPETHPAHVQRAARSLSRLADSPRSVYAGSRPGVEGSVAMLEQMLDEECARVAEERESRR